MGSVIDEGDIEKGLMTSIKHNQNPNALAEPSPSPSPSAVTPPALVLSNSGKRMDQAGKKKYVKQVTGRHNDTELHLAAQRGDLAALKYSDKETIMRRSRSEFDALHIAASQGHEAIVQLLLDHDPSLCQTKSQRNATPLITAATKGHTTVVKELLSKDSSLLDIPKANGKNALHFAARSGHVEIVKALLEKDQQLARKTDKKGQTALHMAVKGVSSEVVKLLLEADPAIVMLPDKSGFTALHVATRKKRAEIVNELLSLPDTRANVNALTRDHKTALDIAEGLPLSEDSSDIVACLTRCGAVRANELNQPRDELRNTVSQIKDEVHQQLMQTRKTNKNVHGIAKELRKLHREGINNATNSVTVVAVLFATVAFAAIFTVPGGDDEHGKAVVVDHASFKIFFIFNAIALFTSLAVVVVQITLVRGETKAERKVVTVINKLMWLASVCTSVAFIASSYIVVGRKYRWAAVLVTVVGGVIMAGVLGTMTYYVCKFKKTRLKRKKDKMAQSGSNSFHHNSELSNSEVDRIYAI
ncbi:putative ankyrin repeat-containing domain, PGG domain, ankyrin repeat-containing domain superfamily [Helianthus debilis subsp. tardiflorus]